MRIGYLCQSYPPMVSGAAIVAKHLAEGMVERGHTILVISATNSRPLVSSPIEGLTHVRLPSFHNPLRVGQSWTFWASRKVSAELAKFEPDIIHLHDALTVGLCGLRFARRQEIPVVLTLHQLPSFITTYIPDIPGIHNAVRTGFWAYGDWLLNQCDRVIVPSQTCAQDVWEHIQQPTIVISNGVDINCFTPTSDRIDEKAYLCKKYQLNSEFPIILHVGRLDVDKNVEAVVRAAAQSMNHAKAQLLVVGDGCQRNRLVQLASELGLGERAHFPGYVDREGDLPGLYRSASVFTTASEIETQGLVILEAMASGVPIVAVRATCIPELVQDTINGYLTHPGDINQMGVRIAELLIDPDRAKDMGASGRKMVQKHALSFTIEEYELLYQRAICEKLGIVRAPSLECIRQKN